MSRDSISYTHGDTGTEPSSSLNFEENERPQAQNFDWWWNKVINSINGHAAEFDRLDSDDDGVVDAADGASSYSDSGTEKVTHPTDIDFLDKLSVTDDGDETISIETTALDAEEVRDLVAGFIAGGDKLSWTHDDANDTFTIDTSALEEEEVEDVVAGLISSGDNLDWTYDDANDNLYLTTTALNEEEVEDVVNALLVAGDAISISYDDTNDQLTISIPSGAIGTDEHGDAVTVPVYASLSDVPALSEGELVYNQNDASLYVEDGT